MNGKRTLTGSALEPADPSVGDRPYPPLGKPFKFVSRYLVRPLYRFPINPNSITIAWILLLVGCGYALAINAVPVALVLVVAAELLDCMDGDLARSRRRPSSSGTLLERVGHWTGTMSVAVGASAGLQLLQPGAWAILLGSILCVAQAVYLAVVTQVEIWTDFDDVDARKFQRFLHAIVKINYLLSPVELLLVALLFVFGIHSASIALASAFLLVSALLIFLPLFFIVLSNDENKWLISSSGDFPAASVAEAENLLSSRLARVWYGTRYSRLSPQVLQLGSFQPMDPDASEFERVWRELHEDLPKVFRTTGRVVTLSGSGVAAMETAIGSLLRPGDRVLVIKSGPAGALWSDIARSYGAEVSELELRHDQPPDLERLKVFLAQHPALKAVFATLAEPDTGGVQDIASIGALVGGSGALFVVDAISGIAADDFRMDDWGVDLAIAASHGGLMAQPGLGLIAIGPAAEAKLDRYGGLAADRRYYWNLARHLESLDRSRVVAPTQIVEALHLSIRMILASGLERVLAHRYDVAVGFRRGCTEVLGLSLAAAHPSAACTTVKLPSEIKAGALRSLVLERYAIGIVAGTLPSGEETLILGHSGWVFRDDIYKAIEALALCLETLRNGEPAS
jgi:aspartate aminotransferase-like enzyme/phosphatidylglycerophosphate synthase